MSGARPVPEGVERDFSLSRLTTIRTGGPAADFPRASTPRRLGRLLDWGAEGGLEGGARGWGGGGGGGPRAGGGGGGPPRGAGFCLPPVQSRSTRNRRAGLVFAGRERSGVGQGRACRHAGTP